MKWALIFLVALPCIKAALDLAPAKAKDASREGKGITKVQFSNRK